MPEAPVDEYRDPSLRHNYVCAPTQLIQRCDIDSKAHSTPVEGRPNAQLRLCVASSVCCHRAASMF